MGLILPGKSDDEILKSAEFRNLNYSNMLTVSVLHNFKKGVEIALAHGVKPTPRLYHYAFSHGYTDIVKLILDTGHIKFRTYPKIELWD